MHLALAFLGKFEVRLDGQPVTGFQSDKARALLVMLAVEADRPHRRELLASLFWPDVPDATARTNLRSALLNLRHLLADAAAEPSFLSVARESIQFAPQSDVWLDVTVFKQLLAEAAPQASPDPSPQQVERLVQALELYRGAFLEGITIRDCPGFDTWAYGVRERLEEQATTALRQVSEYYQHSGDTQPAITYARRWAELAPWQEDAHYHLMHLLALCGERSAALAQYETCCRLLAVELGVEPSARTTELYDAIRADQVNDSGPTQRELLPTPGVSPYKGLQYFDISDAGLFFGREALTTRMLEHLRQMLAASTQGASRCLSIVGPSGSGKSSLVRAGLAAVVQRGDFPPSQERLVLGGRRPPFGAEKWVVSVITPTAHPLAVIAAQPTRAASSGEQPLLVVDQFEELFTLCRQESERAAFIEQLLKRPGLVVIALRADFYAHCALYPALRQALTARQEYLGAMGAAELRSAIEEPARRGGWKLEPGLVDLILSDVGAGPQRSPEPGALPLLSHALLETWKRRRGRTLTIQGYAEAGGVQGVIAKTAETVFAGLDAEQQATARRIFLRLTELGEANSVGYNQDTRRRASLADLVPAGGSQEATLEVVRRLANARLVVLEADPVSKQLELEMAHEALIRSWPRLRGWLEEDRAELRLAERVRDAAQEWQAAGRIAGLLVHRGERLESALRSTDAGQMALNQVELDYLLACRGLRDRELAARERRRGLIIALSVGITLVMALITLWGAFQAAEARRQAEISLGQQLAAQVGEMLTRPLLNETAMLLAIEAVRHSPDRTANEVLANSLSLFPQTLARMDENGRVTRVAFSPDGQHVAAASLDHTLRVWNSTGQIQVVMQQDGPIWSFAFSPDGQSLVSGGQDGTARVWSLDGREIARLEVSGGATNSVGAANSGGVEMVAFSPDGKHIATAGADGAACIWESASWRRLACTQHTGIVYSVAFSPDGQLFVSGGQDGVARVADLGGMERARVPVGSEIWTVAFAPDSSPLGSGMPLGSGLRIITGGWDGVARVWDISGQDPAGNPGAPASALVQGREISAMRHHEDARVAAFSPDGTWALSASDDGSVRVWETDSGREVAHVQHQSRVLAACFSPDGKWVLSTSEDGMARVWEASSGREVARMQHNGAISSAAFSLDGQRAITGGWDGVVRVWQLTGMADSRLTAGGVAAAGRDAAAVDEGVNASIAGRETALMMHDGGVSAVAFSPDGQWVASGSDDGTARVWAARSGQEAARMQHGGRVLSIAFSPDGQRVVSGSEDNTARVWEAHSGRELARAQHAGPVTALAFSPDGQQVVSGSQDGALRLWPAAGPSEPVGSGELSEPTRSKDAGPYPLVILKEGEPVSAAAFSADGSRVIAGSTDGLLQVWKITRGEAQPTARLHTGQVLSALAISQDGRYAVTGSQAGMLQVWQIASGHEVGHLLIESPVSAVAISSNAKWILSGGRDGALRVWDFTATSGRELARVQHNKAVTAASFSQDGRRIASGSQDGGVRLLLWQNEDLVSLACTRLTRNLSRAEWEQYMGDRPYHATCPNLPGGK